MKNFVRASENQQPIETNIYMCEGLFVKHALFSEGTFIPQHQHHTDHLTVIATGSVRVWTGDGDQPAETLLGDFHAPAGILIKAHTKHLFQALSEHTAVLCVHHVADDGDPIIDEEHSIVSLNKE